MSKLDGYAALRRATGLDHWVLFWLSSPGREASLRERLATHPDLTSVPLAVATASGATVHPAGPVWARVGGTGRRRLSHLAATPGD